MFHCEPLIRWGAGLGRRRPRRRPMSSRLGRTLLTALALGAAAWALTGPSDGSPLPSVSCTGSGFTISGTTITGTGGNDTIDCSASTANLTINGQGGSDTIKGGSGDDTINGGGGNDNLYGNGGNDTISGGSGNDDIWGGDGDDTIYGEEGNDNIRGEGGNDTIFGGSDNDRIDGGEGNDILHGEGGQDDIDGGNGNDCLTGGPGQDRLDGQGGNDQLSGGNGGDTLRGGDGDDHLKGGQGDDELFGGKGADTFDNGDQALERKDFDASENDTVSPVTIPCEGGGVCGNGKIESGEQCDDGNTNDNDGCSSSCQIESGWSCSGQPSSCSPICGDGEVKGNEQCDLGSNNGQSGSCCTSTCKFVSSGTVCRLAAGECDEAEYCKGDSATCPENAFKDSGTPCTDDGNQCTDDVCNGSGQCTHPNKQNGTTCNDGNRCTENDQCSSGQCSGTPKNCDDGKSCTTDSCNQDNGQCINTINQNTCLINGTCYNAKDNNPQNECQRCDPQKSQTSFSSKPDNTPCTDDGKSCSDDVCQNGSCTHPLKPAGTACHPGDSCPANEACTGSSPDCPRPDEDGDGVRNACDFCPTTPTGSCANHLTLTAASFSLVSTSGQAAAVADESETAQVNNSGLLVTDFALNQVIVFLSKGDGTFQRFRTYTVGDGPLALGIGDFNADGKTDWITANYLSNTLTVGLGNGDGTFGRLFHIFLISGVNPSSLAVADFNRDGRLDVAVANFGSDNVTILLGREEGRFAEVLNIPISGHGPSALAATDLDLDGVLDLVVTNFLSNDVSLLLGNGQGWFAEVRRLQVREGPVAVTVADLNRDGRPDITTASFAHDAISVLLSRPGSLTFARTDLSTGQGPMALVTGEFVPGTLSLATANFSSNSLSVIEVGEERSARNVRSMRTLANPTSLAVGDFNADGRVDIAVVGSPFAQLLTLLNAGDGTFVLKR